MSWHCSSKLEHICLLCILVLVPSLLSGPNFALKTDIPGWATASLNIEPEVRLAPLRTLALGVAPLCGRILLDGELVADNPPKKDIGLYEYIY